ncbi:basic salivary proline-rich protein 2-like [Balaenoptera ricei]|uniref:basic salivary proline-rich protein 2-like n=1 Tax=Balaenoptera ricei TaxID=2746895 RepID=UPI0028BE2CC3|nr:basic salivary proline-rich protein 2-like [Balaenoptera ricei]
MAGQRRCPRLVDGGNSRPRGIRCRASRGHLDSSFVIRKDRPVLASHCPPGKLSQPVTPSPRAPPVSVCGPVEMTGAWRSPDAPPGAAWTSWGLRLGEPSSDTHTSPALHNVPRVLTDTAAATRGSDCRTGRPPQQPFSGDLRSLEAGRGFVSPPSGLKLGPTPSTQQALSNATRGRNRSTFTRQENPLTLVPVDASFLGLPRRVLFAQNSAAPVPQPPRNRSSVWPCRRPPSLQEQLVTAAPSCLQRALPPDLGNPGRKRSKQRLQLPAVLSSFICPPPSHPPIPPTPPPGPPEVPPSTGQQALQAADPKQKTVKDHRPTQPPGSCLTSIYSLRVQPLLGQAQARGTPSGGCLSCVGGPRPPSRLWPPPPASRHRRHCPGTVPYPPQAGLTPAARPAPGTPRFLPRWEGEAEDTVRPQAASSQLGVCQIVLTTEKGEGQGGQTDRKGPPSPDRDDSWARPRAPVLPAWGGRNVRSSRCARARCPRRVSRGPGRGSASGTETPLPLGASGEETEGPMHGRMRRPSHPAPISHPVQWGPRRLFRKDSDQNILTP